MNVLIIGSGGREHAFAWKLKQSPKLDHLFIAPGNAGTALCGTNVNIAPLDFDALGRFAVEHQVGMVVVGPEDPLVMGIYDYFRNNEALKHIPVIGPCKEGAQLEGSKDFSKQFMQRHNIPTAASKTFTKDTLE
ncbi:MAG TPA: phosphoribosylamine--glycine ligase, partial [Bacteroidia bacterium]|nr:phosphoribosylamine--glycine ligase [Bacteroidia bacterium]